MNVVAGDKFLPCSILAALPSSEADVFVENNKRPRFYSRSEQPQHGNGGFIGVTVYVNKRKIIPVIGQERRQGLVEPSFEEFNVLLDFWQFPAAVKGPLW